jgi:HEAT repeat protein
MPRFDPGSTLPAILAVLAGAAALHAADPPATDPVDELRTALRRPETPLDPDGLRARQADIEERVKALRLLRDLRRALLLDEWSSFAGAGDALLVRARAQVLARFLEEARTAFVSKDPADRAAAVTLVGDAGAVLQAAALRNPRPLFDPDGKPLPRSPGGPLAGLTSDLKRRTADDDPGVRAAAARALGRIQPDPEEACKTLGDLLAGSEKEPVVRRAAAAALGDLFEASRGPSSLRGEVGRGETVGAGAQVVPAAVKGLAGEDRETRRLCLETIRQAAMALTDSMADLPRAENLPQGADLAPQLKAERAGLQPLAAALNQSLSATAKAFGADDPEVCMAAGAALEAVAVARRQLLRRGAVLARHDDGKVPDDLLSALKDALPVLTKNLTHADVRVRLASLYTLETMEAAAEPAADALVKALRDDDAFVRWGAVRALGKMAPLQAEKAVPALADALKDKDADVRLTAAVALTRYGPAGKPAVAALAEAVKTDAGARLWAARALEAIGADAAPAAPALAAALESPEAEVRLAAARALGRIGSATGAVRDALRKALTDAAPEVREAAAEALLTGKKD